jgi:hypothetical protein
LERASSNLLGIICPPVEIGLTDISKSGDAMSSPSGTPSSDRPGKGYKALGAIETRIELYVNADSEKTTHFRAVGRSENPGVPVVIRWA